MTIVGTRPEIIKLCRIIAELDKYSDHILVHTGQNYDYELNEIFFKDLRIRKPNHFLEAVGKNTAETISKIIYESDKIIDLEKPDAILLYGDTNSCLSVISAKRKQVPIFHMEAGNRCFDDRVPEEVNRRIVDHFSDINLTYSNYASENLQREGLRKDRIIKVGSPLMEVYDKYKKQIEKNDILKKLNLTKNNYILASIHREENVSKLSNVKKILEGIYRIKKELKVPIIFSTHPRTKSILKKVDLNIKKEINFLKPFGFFEFAKLLKNAKLTISDSGSITEEASILSIPTVNLRSTNERQEGMEFGISIMSGLSADSIFNSYKMSMKNKDVKKSYPDYSNLNVSNTVSTIIQSYTHYINDKVWLKKN